MIPGLIGEYRFDGNADDTSGNGRHGVVYGAALTADRFGHERRALFFDGSDDYVEVSPPPSFSNEALTVSAWVCYAPRSFTGWTNCIISQDDGNDDDQARRVFQISTDGGHIVWHRMMGARDAMCPRRVRPHVWQHVVAVHDGGVNRLYVDGVLQDVVNHAMWTHPEQPLHIGRKGTDEPYFFFHGAIDDVRLYDRALPNDEISALLHERGWQAPSPAGIPVSGDPLSGQWGREGVVFLDVKYDGKVDVSGEIMAGRPDNMAPIATGRFDPQTGSLRLEGVAKDFRSGAPVAFRIEGLLDDDELTVVARFNDYAGNFMLTRDGCIRA